MKPSKKSHFLTLLAILCMGMALSASRLRLPAFSQSAGAATQAAVVGNDTGDPAAADRSVVLQTDKMNYAPGEVIIITGSGWDPGETVTLQLRGAAAAHENRTVTAIADASGNIFDNQFMQDAHDRGVMLQLTATGRSSGLTTQAAFGNPSANLDQWANVDNAWVNGNLGASKAHYFEGDSIPYRLRFDSLSTGATLHTVTIEWDTTKSSKHALDYVTTWDRSVPSTTTIDNPCQGVSGCTLGSPSDTEAIPLDPQVTAGAATPQIPGVFTLWGGNITRVGVPPTYSTPYAYASGSGFTGDKSAKITIEFTATVANPVLAWGGHISTRIDWGPLGSAVSIPGSPYHTRLVDLDGSGGNQDRSLSAAAVTFLGSITINKACSSSDATASFGYTASPSPLGNFNLGCGGIKAFTGINVFQKYDITESSLQAGWALTPLTAGSCSVTSPNSGSVSTINSATGVEIDMKEGENWSCTFTNNAPTQTPTPTDTPVPPTSTPTATPTPTPPCLSTDQSLIPNDSATIDRGDASGTITFDLYGPSNAGYATCSGPADYHKQVAATVPGTYSTDNSTFVASEAGTWKWKVTYSDVFGSATSACGTENFVITNDHPACAQSIGSARIAKSWLFTKSRPPTKSLPSR